MRTALVLPASECPMDEKESPLEREHTLVVVLPGGLEKTTTVHGSKPVMDLLVTLCATYHLNPSEYHVDLLSPNSNQITFKPNSPIGSLEAERIVLKPKDCEKVKRTYVPEATVRLLINYRKSHKTVVRVNPRLPLDDLLPAICHKCDLNIKSTILLRNSNSQEPLDLSMSLNSHGVRELFAKDTAEASLSDVTSSPTQEDVEDTDLPKTKDKEPKKQKENKGFFSLFKRRKNKIEKQGASVSAPVSPGLSQRTVNTLGSHTSNTLPLDAPKKRRAPPPPMAASCSVPANLNASHLMSLPLGSPDGQAARLSSVSSSESCLRRTKRRAPPPPSAKTDDNNVPKPETSLSTVEELRECEETSPAPALSHPREHTSHPAPNTDSSVGAVEPPAPLSLAEILTSSLGSRPSPRPWSPADASSTDAVTSQPHQGVCFPSATGCPVRLRATPTGRTWRGGMTTFRVEPRGSFLRQRPLEQECGLRSGSAGPPFSQAGLSSPEPQRPALLSHSHLCPSTSRITSSPLHSPSPSSTPHSPSYPPNSPSPSSTSYSPSYPPNSPSPSSPPHSPSYPPHSPSPSSPPHSPSSSTVLRGTEAQPGEAQQPEGELKSRETPVSLASPSLSLASSTLLLSHSAPDDNVSSTSEEQEPGRGTIQKGSETPPDTGASCLTPEEDEGFCFPPPPPPMFLEMEGEGCPPEGTSTSPSSARPSLQGAGGEDSLAPETSPRFRRPCLAKLLKRTGTVPSRFAQAVALAVQRSQRGPHDQGPDPDTESCGPSSTLSHTNMVPEWLPCSSLNGSSCLG